MIAMQYSFVLPADYDMAVVRERIATKGPLLDDLPGLVFKAYLYALEPEQSYAPFYLWHDEEAMHGFLNGPAFAGVARAFGWPSVKTWTPWHTTVSDAVREARFATRSSAVIKPYAALAELRLQEEALAQQMLAQGALAVVVGFESVTWTLTRLALWRDAAAAGVGASRAEGRSDLVRADGADGGSGMVRAGGADGGMVRASGADGGMVRASGADGGMVRAGGADGGGGRYVVGHVSAPGVGRPA